MNIILTPKAEKFISRMIRFNGGGSDAGFRLSVSPGGCSGLSSSFTIEAAPLAGDAVLESNGVKLFLPAESRILLEGVRAEVSVAELCRREGIHPTVYYKWLKDFMEAGKNRLRGDTKREANREEVEQLRQENERLKQLVADLSLANMTLKKSQY